MMLETAATNKITNVAQFSFREKMGFCWAARLAGRQVASNLISARR
jgi:hypothetical protein